MKRLLTRRTQIGFVGRSTATLAARRRGVAIEVRGGCIRGRLINRRWHGNLRHRGRLGRQRRPAFARIASAGQHDWNGGRTERRQAGKVRFENRIDHRVRGYG